MGKQSPEDREIMERILGADYREVCPSCGSLDLSYACAFSYGIWTCYGCGAHLDSRVVSPDFLSAEERAARAASVLSGQPEADR